MNSSENGARTASPGLRGLFVTGTDTGVGKTEVTAAILHDLSRRGVRAGVMKPVASGVTDPPSADDDAGRLMAALGRAVPRERVVFKTYAEPLAPVVAARRAGTPLEHPELRDRIRSGLAWWAEHEHAELVLVEGVGGLLCPLAEGTTIADLALDLGFPLIIVARRGLGTLNHTLLTLEAARHLGLHVAGIVLNGSEPTADPVAEQTNPEELARRIGTVPILAVRPHGHEPVHPFDTDVDWEELAGPGAMT